MRSYKLEREGDGKRGAASPHDVILVLGFSLS